MSLKCFHWSLICCQFVGFIPPQMLFDVVATMIVSTRPPRLSKPISMVVDIKLSLTISDIDNYVFFRTIQPQFLHHILINIRRITAFSSFKKLLTCKRLSPCLRMTGTVRKAILLCACSCSVSYVLDLFSSDTDVSAFPSTDPGATFFS